MFFTAFITEAWVKQEYLSKCIVQTWRGGSAFLFLFFCKSDGHVCSSPLMIRVEWRVRGVRQILFISVFAQSLSKSPLLASKLHLRTRRPQLYSFFFLLPFPSPPNSQPVMSDSSSNVVTAEYGMDKGIRGVGSVKEAQQPISSQLDCRIPTRWVGLKEKDPHEAAPQWVEFWRTKATSVLCWVMIFHAEEGEGRSDQLKAFKCVINDLVQQVYKSDGRSWSK